MLMGVVYPSIMPFSASEVGKVSNSSPRFLLESDILFAYVRGWLHRRVVGWLRLGIYLRLVGWWVDIF